MPYTAKLIIKKSGPEGEGGNQRVFPFVSCDVTYLPLTPALGNDGEDNPRKPGTDRLYEQPGVLLEFTGGPVKSVILPDNGEEIFFVNELGKTVDSHRWPPRPKQKEFRA